MVLYCFSCAKMASMYADDSSSEHFADDIKDITNVMNSEMKNAQEWLHANKISLNVTKTTYMLIGTSHFLHDNITGERPLRANFEISGESIEQICYVKYQGVQINNELTWKDHIEAVSLKVTRAIRMIKNSKKFIQKFLLKMLYHGLVEPHFRFCCLVWGICRVTTRHFLGKLRKIESYE